MANRDITVGSASFAVPGVDEPCQTWYTVYGSLGGDEARDALPPLIVLHGGPGACHDYLLPLSDLNTFHGRPVVFYDQLGNGRSTHLPERKGDAAFWTERLFQDELDNLIAHLGLRGRPVDVLGQSWGGMLAVGWATNSPHARHLRRLVLSNSLASMASWLAGIAKLREALPDEVEQALRRGEKDRDFESDEYQQAIEVFYRRHVCRKEPWPAPEVKAALHWLTSDDTTYSTMWGPNELYVDGSLRDWDCTAVLDRIAVPTLVIYGAQDEATALTNRPFVERIPNVKEVVIDNASHFSHVEQRRRYVRVLIEFLESGAIG